MYTLTRALPGVSEESKEKERKGEEGGTRVRRKGDTGRGKM